ncbi:MAG: PhzF family phenazine biosynthesis protein [Spirochaetes bacterium]|nr:PhzF family phenazine biosynthesis protein [Spirochaetota bacterium]
MKQFTFKKIDAFAAGASRGNPAAVVYPGSTRDISEDEMQKIAKELKGFVSEVVYVFPEGKGFFLRYYSSECEVDFCGHGTVAAMHDCIMQNKKLLKQDIIAIRVKNERLSVHNRIRESNSIFITSPAPSHPDHAVSADDIAAALGVAPDAVDQAPPLALINAGLNTFIVPIKKLDRCLSMKPGQENLRQFCISNNIDIVLVFSSETSKKDSNFRTRVFAPKYGYLEDPATGSGNSAFGYYLLKHKLWDGRLLVIEQNDSFENPNIVKLDTIRHNEKTFVIFGGSAIVRLEGMYNLYSSE